MKSYSAKFLWSQTALIAHNGRPKWYVVLVCKLFNTIWLPLTLSLSSSNMLRNTKTFRGKIKHVTKSSIVNMWICSWRQAALWHVCAWDCLRAAKRCHHTITIPAISVSPHHYITPLSKDVCTAAMPPQHCVHPAVINKDSNKGWPRCMIYR